MFWSKTKDVVHAYIRSTSCFVTMENTLLGSVLDGLSWCGKEGSKSKSEEPCYYPKPEVSLSRGVLRCETGCSNLTLLLSTLFLVPGNSTPVVKCTKLTHLDSKCFYFIYNFLETFTDDRDCHIARDCKDNPVHSFWGKGSACVSDRSAVF